MKNYDDTQRKKEFEFIITGKIIDYIFNQAVGVRWSVLPFKIVLITVLGTIRNTL